MKKFFCTICTAIFLLGMVGASEAGVLTFDDISTDEIGTIFDGYGGFNWNNMGYLNGPTRRPGSGYDIGSVSGDYVAYNKNANVATATNSTFNFYGAFLTGAWNDNLNIEVKGFNNNVELYSETVVVNTYEATWFDFNFLGIDSVQFRSFGGNNAGLGSAGEHFAMDNFSTCTPSPVPVPGALWLLGSGLVGLAGIRIKKLQK